MVREELRVAKDGVSALALHAAFDERDVERRRGNPSLVIFRTIVGAVLRRLMAWTERPVTGVETILGESRAASQRDAEDASAGCGTGRERLETMGACVAAVGSGDRTSLARVTFINESGMTVTVVALESPAFARVEMRTPARLDKAGATCRIDALEIRSGNSVVFSPEARQLRLIGPHRPLDAGQLVGITATFSSGQQRVMPFLVVENTLHG